jgi:hypothetical protein
MGSEELKNRRTKVLFVPGQPRFNTSTLLYVAEVDWLPISFSYVLKGPVTTQQLQECNFILVKDTDYQGPESSTRYTDQIYERPIQPGWSVVASAERFAFPDHSDVVTVAATPQ